MLLNDYHSTKSADFHRIQLWYFNMNIVEATIYNTSANSVQFWSFVCF